MAKSQVMVPGRGVTRYQIGAALAAAGLALFYAAVKFQSEPYWSASPLERRDGAKYSRLWIDAADEAVGAKVDGSQVTIEKWSGGSWGAEVDSPSWSISPDFKRIVWISGDAIQVASEDGKKIAIDLKRNLPVAAGSLTDGSIFAVFREGAVGRWDGAGKPIGTSRLTVGSVDQAALEGDYLAVASNASRVLLLYRFEDQQWKVAQQAPAPDSAFRIIVPGPGVLAEVIGGAVRIGDETRNPPGGIRAAVAALVDLIATGDFEGVYVLPPERERYRLADAQPGSVLAASHTKLAVSGPAGTAILTLASGERLSATGRTLSRIALLLIAGAALAAFSGLLLSALTGLFGNKQKLLKMKIPMELGPPPPDLVKAVASDQCLLWAGSGLSAQAGYPTRQAFAAMLLQAATIEEWLNPVIGQTLQTICAKGKTEEALAELLATAPEARGKFLEFVRSAYARFGVPSRTHELLATLQFPAAITTNYDGMLEKLRDDWKENTVTLGQRTTARNFVVKLYGDFRDAQTVLLTRDEYGKAAQDSGLALSLAQALETRTMLFIGCSVEGLLADLSLLNIGKTPTRTHYAVAGVSGKAWQAAGETLGRRYGIELLLCDESGIGTAVPAFLQRLLEEVLKSETGVAGETVAKA